MIGRILGYIRTPFTWAFLRVRYQWWRATGRPHVRCNDCGLRLAAGEILRWCAACQRPTCAKCLEIQHD